MENYSKFIVKDIVNFKDINGNNLGKLDAYVNFDELPPDLHHLAIKLLNNMPVTMEINSHSNIGKVLKERSDSIIKEPDNGFTFNSIWEKIKYYFNKYQTTP